VSLSSLRPADGGQLPLFPGAEPALETERDRTVARTVDRVRARFGDGAILPASLKRR
jgi:hypothetical protein